ncbi:MAG: P1 family peptidase [Candidatus Latescibacteria bacterium]|jgi:D-aminopeptidase|nr:P1 family peptidase [Candidatus Latescibacterota bacterium]
MSRPRAREAGIAIGSDPTGSHNAITDVPGIRVGHVTLIEGEGPTRIGQGPVRTGVTAIVPPEGDWYGRPFEAGQFTFNGAGTTAGLTLIDEYAQIHTPIMLTNSLSVGTVYEGVVQYMVDYHFKAKGDVPWFNPVVGETSDAYLNDIGGLHVRPEHAVDAIKNATDGPVEEGTVGGGTGMSVFGFKGGIGTSSRILDINGERGTVGVLVQSNFGGRLHINGISMAEIPTVSQPPTRMGSSIMMIIATDLPLSNRLLNRVCKRATFGLARAGSNGGHGSGDYVIAFSTTCRALSEKQRIRDALTKREGLIDHVFTAVADATEEAILNSLFKATTLVGRDGHTREAFPIERGLKILKRHNVLE